MAMFTLFHVKQTEYIYFVSCETSKIIMLSGSRDSNPESLVPKTSMLAVTPHPEYARY